jgi:hypothetical protein
MLSHRHVQLTRYSFSLRYMGESSRVSSQLSTHRRTINPSHGILPFSGAQNIPSLSQRGTTHPAHEHTQLMGYLTPHRGTQCSFFVLERNYTPKSWAQPTHGISLRSTHSVCVLEDVSHSSNHQHSLSAREAFSTQPGLSWK